MGFSAISFTRSYCQRLWPEKILFLGLLGYITTAYTLPYFFWVKVTCILVAIGGYGLVFSGVILQGKRAVIEFIPVNIRWSFFWLTLFSLWALWRIFNHMGWSAITDISIFFIASLPMMLLALSRLCENHRYMFLLKSVLFFLLFQLLVVLGQASANVSGYGFPLPAVRQGETSTHYITMLSGTFYNANDLAAVTLLAGGVLLIFSARIHLLSMVEPQSRNSFWMVRLGLSIVIILLLLSASRSALLILIVSVFFLALRHSIKRAIFLILLLSSLISLFLILGKESFEDFGFIYRIIWRVESISFVLSGGFSDDASLSPRLNSYLHFISNLPDIGLGTGVFRDYNFFVSPIITDDFHRVFAVNPHAFFVEIGYWLGWPGLISFIFSLLCFRASFNLFFILILFFVASLISSSVVNNFMFFLMFYTAIALLQRLEQKSNFSSPVK